MSELHDLSKAPLWKQSLIILLALFPAVMLETLYLFPHLTFLNPVLSRFLGVILITCTLSLILMPTTLYLMGWWLKPQSLKRQLLGVAVVIGIYVIEICFFLLIS